MPPLHDGEEATSDDPTPRLPPPTASSSSSINTPLATAAGMMGNVLEWYDFALFGFFSDVIAKNFFPPSADDASADGANYDGEPHGNLVYSFAVFAGAFLMRPVGGILIGFCGDKHGRKAALVPALFLMAIPTFLMGCLPTYEQVGGLSTALLVLCRLVQGMSVGGQLPASLVYTVETRPREQWGYYGSLVMWAANVGTLLGNMFGALLRSVLTYDQLLSWGWRIPFWTGILNAGVAMFLHYAGEEHHPNEGVYDTSKDGEVLKEGGELPRYPIREVCRRENLPALVSIWLTSSLYGAGFYTSFVWMATYMGVLIDPPLSNGFWINAMALLFGIVFILPLAGKLSDTAGRLPTMFVGSIGLAIAGPLMLGVISKGQGVQAFFAQWCIGVFLSLFGGPMNAWLVEQFPPKIRLTSVALGYDLAHATAAAFSPLIATVLYDKHGPVAPGLIYPIFAVIAMIGMFASTRTRYDAGIEDDDRTDPLIDESVAPVDATLV